MKTQSTDVCEAGRVEGGACCVCLKTGIWTAVARFFVQHFTLALAEGRNKEQIQRKAGSLPVQQIVVPAIKLIVIACQGLKSIVTQDLAQDSQHHNLQDWA